MLDAYHQKLIKYPKQPSLITKTRILFVSQDDLELASYYLNHDAIDMAILILEDLSRKDNLEAILQLAYLYKNRSTKTSKNQSISSKSPEETDALAERYYRLAAGLGSIEGAYLLGSHLCEYDYRQIEDAIPWLLMAANKGHAKAAEKLAGLYCLKHKYSEALGYYERARRLPSALYCEAMLYFSNKIQPPGFTPKLWSPHSKSEQVRIENYSRGYSLLVKSAESGYAEAQYRLGLLLREGFGELRVVFAQKNVQQGEQMLRNAAQQGHIGAQNILDGRPTFDHPRSGFN